jgi:tetratricopeptide (TPR) repeat protein/predicted Ser/Thr protein kinase
MGTSHSNLAGLTEPDRRMLEAWLEEFDRSWEEGRLAKLVRMLPPPSTPTRLPALLELIKIDLRRRWQRGQQVTVESYLRTYPELGNVDTAPISLVLAEHAARKAAGLSATPRELYARFPKLADELRRHLEPHAAQPPPQAPRSAAVQSTGVNNPPNAPTLTSPVPGFLGNLPEQFGRYRILKRLGSGGMGSVYLAQDTQLDRKVALKVPHFTEDDGPEILARFQREARAAATVQHPGICPVYDVGEINGTHYLAMAYIEGQSLKEMVADGHALPQRQAAELVCQLALALEEAHRRGIIHRDLKPTNVLLNQRGEPVILDFGLARRLNAESVRLTRTGAVLGTPAYMPPEQVTGDLNAVGPRSDIYSLGVILYELLTGRVPYEGPLAAIVGRLLIEEPTPPSKLRRDLDPRLEAACLKAMAKKPQDRFASMTEFAAALDGYIQATGGSGSSSGVRRPPVRTPTPSAPSLQPGPGPVRLPVGGAAAPRPSRPVPVPQPGWREAAPKEPLGGGFAGLIIALLIALLLGAVLVFLIVRYAPTLFGAGRTNGTEGTEANAGQPTREAQGGPPGGKAPPTKFDQGLDALRRNDFASAVVLFNAVLQADPRNAPALHKRGFAHMQQADYDQALADLNASLQLDPNQIEALNDRGVAFTDRAEYDNALADFDAALRIDSKYAPALANRGLVYGIKRDFERALAECREAVALDPKLSRAYSNRGYVHMQMGQFDLALRDADEAVRLDPKSARALRFRGLIHVARKDYDQAIAEYDKALQVDPKHVQAYHVRGGAYRAKKEYGRALEDFTEAIRLAPKYPQAYLARADTYRLMQEFDKALDDCTRAIALAPSQARGYLTRGNLYYAKEDYEQAVADFTAAIVHEPSNADAYNARGNAHRAQKDVDSALRDYSAAIEHDPQYFWPRYNRAMISMDRKQYDDALKDLDVAVKLDPNHTQARALRAEAQRLSRK